MNATTRRLPEIEFEKEMSQKARDLYMAALAAEKAGKFSEALRQYKAAAREDTEFREAFVNLGALYSRAKRPDLAIGFFRRALDLRAGVFLDAALEPRDALSELCEQLLHALGPQLKPRPDGLGNGLRQTGHRRRFQRRRNQLVPAATRWSREHVATELTLGALRPSELLRDVGVHVDAIDRSRPAP